MTAPTTTGRLKSPEHKRLHLVLRDSTLLEGSIFISDDMSLVSFLASRKGGWTNMVEARRAKVQEEPGHMIVQADHIVLASAPDQNVQVLGASGAGAGERDVEIILLGGKSLRGVIFLAAMQRMSDYLHQSGKFIGMARATLMPDGREIGDVAVNAGAVTLIRETKGAE